MKWFVLVLLVQMGELPPSYTVTGTQFPSLEHCHERGEQVLEQMDNEYVGYICVDAPTAYRIQREAGYAL